MIVLGMKMTTMLIMPIGNTECEYLDYVFVVYHKGAGGNGDEEDDLGEGGNLEEDEADEEESYDRGVSLEDEDEVLNDDVDDDEEPYSRQDFPKEDQFDGEKYDDDAEEYDDEEGKEFGENTQRSSI